MNVSAWWTCALDEVCMCWLYVLIARKFSCKRIRCLYILSYAGFPNATLMPALLKSGPSLAPTSPRSIKIVVLSDLLLLFAMHSRKLLLGALRAIAYGHELNDNNKQLRISLSILQRISERVRSGQLQSWSACLHFQKIKDVFVCLVLTGREKGE